MIRRNQWIVGLLLSATLLLLSPAFTTITAKKKDKTPPAVTLSMPAPTGNNGWYNEPISVYVRAWDSGSGVGSVMVSLGGGAWYKRALSIRRDGTYLVIGRATDKAGNSSSVTRLIHVDMTPPTVSFNIPNPDGMQDWYVNPVNISLFGKDNLSGVFKTDLYATGSFEKTDRGLLDRQESYAFAGEQSDNQVIMLGDISSESNASIKLSRSGTYQISGYVEDIAGNRTPVETRLTIDTHTPVITFNPPEDYYGDIKLTGSLVDDDSGIKQVWVDKGNGWQPVGFNQSSWQTTLNTDDLKDGDYQIRAKVMDRAGNFSRTSYTVTVVNHIWPILAICGILVSLGWLAMHDPRKEAMQELTITLAKYSHMDRSASRIRKDLE